MEREKNQERVVKIVDTTLRDGEQTAGVVFSIKEKLRIASLLDEIGVDQIEAGIPAMGGDEKEAIAAISEAGLRASIMAWNRAVVSDIQHSIDCGVDAVAVSIATSDLHIERKLGKSRSWVLQAMEEAVKCAKDHGLYVSVNAEDASRSDHSFLVEFMSRAREAGANRFRYCDTVGVMHPFSIYEAVSELRRLCPALDIEMHTHNDFGLATANALSGIRAGAAYVGVTVNGLGERAGNAPLEEVVMALKHLYHQPLKINTARLSFLSDYVAVASGRPLAPGKAIVGPSIFAHESGIHVHGMVKDPDTYEAFSPEEVGLNRRVVIGKHSGTTSLAYMLEKMGIAVENSVLPELLRQVRHYAVDLKRSLTYEDLGDLYHDALRRAAGESA